MMPPPHARIDWSHPLAQGLIAYVLPVDGSGIELVHRSGAVTAGTPPTGVTSPMGAAITSNGGRFQFGTSAYNLSTAGQFSVAQFVRRPTGGGLIRTLNRWGSTGAVQQWLLYIDASGNPVFIVCDGSATTTLTSSGATVAVDEWTFLSASHSGSSYGNTNTIFKNGVQIAIGTASRNMQASSASNLCLGNSDDPSTETGGSHGVAMAWGRYVFPYEYAQLAADPFQVLTW
jgi:hypothetical protein